MVDKTVDCDSCFGKSEAKKAHEATYYNALLIRYCIIYIPHPRYDCYDGAEEEEFSLLILPYPTLSHALLPSTTPRSASYNSEQYRKKIV